MWTYPLSSESHLPVAILRFEARVTFHINRALRLHGHREWPLPNRQPFRPAAATSSESLARGILHQQLRVPMLVGRIKNVKTKNNSTLVYKMVWILPVALQTMRNFYKYTVWVQCVQAGFTFRWYSCHFWRSLNFYDRM